MRFELITYALEGRCSIQLSYSGNLQFIHLLRCKSCHARRLRLNTGDYHRTLIALQVVILLPIIRAKLAIN